MFKNILVTTLVTFGLISCQPANAQEIKEMYAQLNEDAILVISNAECVKWKAPDGYQLNFAYALNTKTKEVVSGCFTHEGDNIIVQLADEESKTHFEYKVHADKFKVRASL